MEQLSKGENEPEKEESNRCQHYQHLWFLEKQLKLRQKSRTGMEVFNK
jgi:hypothetical protein